jgi:hypothetical protein
VLVLRDPKKFERRIVDRCWRLVKEQKKPVKQTETVGSGE